MFVYGLMKVLIKNNAEYLLCIKFFLIFYTLSLWTDFKLIENGSLHLPEVSSMHADTYICTARSPAGSAHDHTDLVIHGKSEYVCTNICISVSVHMAMILVMS